MAKVKQITVGIERTINLGNYENVRYSVQTTVDLDENDIPDDVYANKLNWCKSKVMAELDRLFPPKDEPAKKSTRLG